MSTLPVLIYPTLHYQNGGVTINPESESEIDNLYVAGEVSGGIHGRNRLMGNSLLDILVYGRRAGVNAARKCRDVTPGRLSLDHLARFMNELNETGLSPEATSPLLLPDYVGKLG